MTALQRVRRRLRPRIKGLLPRWHEAVSFTGEILAGARPRRDSAVGEPIVRENRHRGTPPSVWDIDGIGDPSIQGFATDVSVNVGNTISFKIDTDAIAYTIEIFRLGYYRGKGARKVADISPSAILPQRQPSGLTDASVGLVDCGNWAVSASWDVPISAVSGVYIAKLTRTDTRGASHIPFVVRDDASTAEILFQTSDTTWQAYNRYGGSNLYTGSATDNWENASRARKLSYNRPFTTRGDDAGRSFLFSTEYPAIRFLERNGYNVTYAAGVDTDRRGPESLRTHRVFLSIGHDEYWSGRQRHNVQQARDAGVNLMFLSGNEMFWRTRLEPDIDGTTPHRTLVCFKDTYNDGVTDVGGEPTGTWRDPRLTSASIPNVPENALTGTLFMANEANFPIAVTAEEGKLRLWRGTKLASMRSASTALAPHTVGYESDEDVDNGFRPAGLIRLSTATGPSPAHATGFGIDETHSTTTHHLTLYRAASGSLVFSAGTVQWAWGLDRHHDGIRSAADRRIQQATVNMLADMHVRPATLMPGLIAAEPSTDVKAPVSTITAPAPDQKLVNGSRISVRGTAVETGGGQVAGVEVSIDSGATWHPADGTTSWSYVGVIFGDGPVTILSRATDDSANTELTGARVDVIAVGMCTLFGTVPPTPADSGDPTPVELGVRFRSAVDGYVTGIRFYKAPGNTGGHTGTLWSADGQPLATGAFLDETPSGWQLMEFAAAVAITAGQTYVASYYAPEGHYSVTPHFFYHRDHWAWPLVAEATVPGRGTFNGVRAAGHGFPTDTGGGPNYYVDPTFSR